MCSRYRPVAIAGATLLTFRHCQLTLLRDFQCSLDGGRWNAFGLVVWLLSIV